MRWYIVSYRHPRTEWIDYGEPINNHDVAVIQKFLEQCPPFTEVRVKVLDTPMEDK